jgi:arylsulfatase A
MNRIKLLLSAAAISLAFPAAFSQGKPNFVIIFADDMGYGDAGCYGHPTIRTPHIDRMAAEGMRMTQFYVAASVCSASRASLLTGRLPVRCNVKGVLSPQDKKGLPQDERTIANLLKEAGYATACIGKWHLGHKSGYLPTDRGFDLYYGIPYSNDMWIDPDARLAENILLREGVTVEEIKANKYYRHNPKYVPLMRQEEVIEFPADQATLTRRYTEEAVAFIKSHRNGSFFLYLAHTMPHIPLYASDEFIDTSPRGLYGDVIEELDWSIGQILQTLEETGLDRRTMVIFTSDNGPWLAQKLNGGSAGPLHGGKFTTWEGGQREPGIFWWPGKIPAGSVNAGLSSTLDMLPTILDFAGSGLPDDRILDGFSLREMLIENGRSPRRAMFYYKGKNLQAIRLGPWKAHYITTSELGKDPAEHDPPLLFNLEEDPGERYDVAKENTEILEVIRKLRIEHEKTFD